MAMISDMQLDALRELANIGSGNAGTSLGAMLGRSVDISVPTVTALPLKEAVASVGDAEDICHGVLVPVVGGVDAQVLMLFSHSDAQKLCGFYGLEAGTPDGGSMLSEVGNILCSGYVGALGQMVGMDLEPLPPQIGVDMLGAIISTVLLTAYGDVDRVLVIDSELIIENENCSLSFLLLPTEGDIELLLGRMGVV